MDKLFICDYCTKKFNTKESVKRHIIKIHNIYKAVEFTCCKCNTIFKNNELLITHTDKCHKMTRYNKRTPKAKSEHSCYVCQIRFPNPRELKFHIREFHFNLLSNVPYLNFKKVNQVWFENVANSKNVVEIKKIAENTILIKKLDDNTNLKVGEQPTAVLDLRDTYPIKKTTTVQCDICFKLYVKSYYNKHRADVHSIIK